MKRVISFMLVAILACFVISCLNDEKPTVVVEKEKSELIKTGEKFGDIHNECLANVYANILKTKTRTSLSKNDYRSMIVSYINDYISANATATTRATNIDVSMFDSISIDEIRASLTEKEQYYIDKAMSLQRQPALTELPYLVENDSELPEANKLAVICFITTLKASTEYWDEHLDEWMTLFETPQTRGWKEVAFADAWWGYQGLVSSGLNLLVGGGAAALASACTAIF